MTYNMTQLAASDTIFKLVTYANDSTGGIFATLMVLAVFFIMFVAMKRYEFSKALLASSGISFMITLFLTYAKIINPIWALVFLILTAGSAFLGVIFD